MPRFYFGIYDGISLPDTTGTDLPDWEAARLQAIKVAGDALKNDTHRIALGENWHMDVTDDSGLLLFRLDFNVATSPATMKPIAHKRDGAHSG